MERWKCMKRFCVILACAGAALLALAHADIIPAALLARRASSDGVLNADFAARF